MRDLGLDWRGQTDTPRRAAATLVATRRLAMDVAAEQALSRLTRAEELARYAARPDELRWVDQDPRADETTVRKALFGSVSRGRRLRARLAPSSSSRIAVSATAWVSDTWRGFTLRRSTLGQRPAAGLERDDLQDRGRLPAGLAVVVLAGAPPPPRPSRRRSQRSSKRLTMLRLGAGGVLSFLPRPRRARRHIGGSPNAGFGDLSRLTTLTPGRCAVQEGQQHQDESRDAQLELLAPRYQPGVGRPR